MPTYQYRCTECGHDLEVVQKFTDASLTECPNCSGQLRKVFNAVGVVFKGSGFYRTDSRTGKGEGSEPAGSGTESGSKDSGGKDGGSKDSGGKDGGSKDSGSKDAKTTTKESKTPAPAASSSSGGGSSTGSKAAGS